VAITIKSVLVTGCSSGLGRDIAVYLAEKGWKVFATARRTEDVEQLKKQGFLAFQLDLNSSESINSVVDAILLESQGALTAVVNNAGSCQIGAVEDLSRDLIRKEFETNVFGPIELTNRLMPVFQKQKNGRIIFIIHANNNAFAFPFVGAESASKNALETFCTALRRETKGRSIFVTGIAPGQFGSSIQQKAIDNFHTMGIAQSSQHQLPYQKLVEFLKIPETLKKAKTRNLLARKVYEVLESSHPPAVCAVPFNAALHRWIHRLLPEEILDLLVSFKMRYFYKFNETI